MPSIGSLGYITIVAGTPQSVFDNMAGIPRTQKVRAVFVQAHEDNTHKCWLQTGSVVLQANGLTTDKTNGKVLDVAAPTLTTGQPTSLPSGSPGSMNPGFPSIEMSELYVDGEHSGDLILVSYLP